jgi:hypothetical protein
VHSRCQHEGCVKSARGDTQHCIAHGGGKRCQQEGCVKSAQGDTQHCVLHGGGRRCQHEGCPKAAATSGTQSCIAHGGGKRCQQEGCTKAVAKAAGSTLDLHAMSAAHTTAARRCGGAVTLRTRPVTQLRRLVDFA